MADEESINPRASGIHPEHLSVRINNRHMRAQQLLAQVLHHIAPYLRPEGEQPVLLSVARELDEPRVPFRQFFERVYVVRYPGQMGETTGVVTERALDAVAAYIDYAEQYRDKCK